MKNTIPMLCAALFALAAFAKTSTPEGWLDDYDAALKSCSSLFKRFSCFSRAFSRRAIFPGSSLTNFTSFL